MQSRATQLFFYMLLAPLCVVILAQQGNAVESQGSGIRVIKPQVDLLPTFKGTPFEGWIISPAWSGIHPLGGVLAAGNAVVAILEEGEAVVLAGPPQIVPASHAVYFRVNASADMTAGSVSAGVLEGWLDVRGNFVAPGNVAYDFENTSTNFLGDGTVEIITFPDTGMVMPFIQLALGKHPISGSGRITVNSFTFKVVPKDSLRAVVSGHVPPVATATPVPHQQPTATPVANQPTPTPLPPTGNFAELSTQVAWVNIGGFSKNFAETQNSWQFNSASLGDSNAVYLQLLPFGGIPLAPGEKIKLQVSTLGTQPFTLQGGAFKYSGLDTKQKVSLSPLVTKNVTPSGTATVVELEFTTSTVAYNGDSVQFVVQVQGNVTVTGAKAFIAR